jgi:hypothetical protein
MVAHSGFANEQPVGHLFILEAIAHEPDISRSRLVKDPIVSASGSAFLVRTACDISDSTLAVKERSSHTSPVWARLCPAFGELNLLSFAASVSASQQLQQPLPPMMSPPFV